MPPRLGSNPHSDSPPTWGREPSLGAATLADGETGFPGRAALDLRLLFLESGILSLIVALAVFLRYRGIDWGLGTFLLHPDEYFITSVVTTMQWPSSVSEYFDSANSPLNPFNHNQGLIYGTFPLFMGKLFGSFTPYTDLSNAQLPGRWLSAAVDTCTVIFVWWIGRMLWNRWTGLLAALLLACTPLHLGAAHYFTTDAWSAAFAAGAFAFSLAAWKHRSWTFYALAGLMIGLAAASKPTMLLAVGFLALPSLELVRLQGWGSLNPFGDDGDGDDDAPTRFPVIFASILGGLVAIWTIRIAQPYTFQGPSVLSFNFDQRYLDTVEYWSNVQSGLYDVPPGIQWADRAPLWFSIKNMVLWGMGPGLGIFALAGLGAHLWQFATARRWPSWPLLITTGWIGFHLVYFGLALSKTARYLLPAYPFLVLFAAWAMIASVRWAWRSGRLRLPVWNVTLSAPRWINPATILPVIAVASTVLYGVAFSEIYVQPHTREVASSWIVENVPDGSTIVNEYWDLGLPVNVPGLAGHTYKTVDIAPYDDETQEKVTRMVGVLQQADYIVLSSNRLWGSIPRMPWRYPMATRYYEALFSGELGFDQVAHFTQGPELFGYQLDDRSAEEALTVYDHPEIYIFKKSDRWDFHAAWSMLNDARGHGGINTRPVQTQPDVMLLDPAGQAEIRSSDSWSALFDPGSLTNRFPVLAWYLAMLIVSLPLAPLMWRWLWWLPDRGYTLSRTLGVVGLGWIVWWIGSLRLLEFGQVPISLAWLAILAVGALAIRGRLAEFRASINALRWRLIGTETVFLLAFLAAVFVRSRNPDLWFANAPGTQLMDMASFNATVLTTRFPAYDPWLSDGVLHTFGFGYVPWAVMTRITGIVPETAFSLTLATLAALVVLNAWQVGTILTRAFLPAGRRALAPWFALAAPLMAIGIGSWRLAQRIGSGDWTLNYDGGFGDLIRGIRTGFESSSLEPGAWIGIQQFTGPGRLEFPLLSYLTGEMGIQHLGMPVFLAGLALPIGYWLRDPGTEPDTDDSLEAAGGWRSIVPAGLAIGVVLGWTIATNPLFGMALLMVAAFMTVMVVGAWSDWRSSWLVLRDTGLVVAGIGATAVIAVAPFFRAYGYFDTARVPLVAPINVTEWVGQFGVVLIPVLLYLVWQAWSAGQEGFGEGVHGGWALIVLISVAIGLAALLENTIVFCMILGLAIGLVIWNRHTRPNHLVILSLLFAANALAIVANRMTFANWSMQQNLPLQFSLVIWLLLAVIAPPILVGMVVSACAAPRIVVRVAKQGLATGALAISIVAMLGGLVYPVQALPQRESDRVVATDATLDSYAQMPGLGQLPASAGLAGDAAAITWMRENLNGRPTILEAQLPGLGYGGRISALTGYPTVIGPRDVQAVQRPSMERMLDWRTQDVLAFYRADRPFAELEPILQDYGVQVIYVGTLERSLYGDQVIEMLDAAVAEGKVERVYDAEGVVIYTYNGGRRSREYQP